MSRLDELIRKLCPDPRGVYLRGGDDRLHRYRRCCAGRRELAGGRRKWMCCQGRILFPVFLTESLQLDMIDAAKISDISISRFGSGLRIIFFEGEKTYEKDLDKAAEWYWKALEAGYEPREEGRRT